MTKKLFAAMILAFTLVVAVQTQAEASEVYVGTYSDGTAVYLLTESISHASRGGFNCRVRAGGDYLTYSFWSDGVWYYRNSEGYSGAVYDGSSPVAASILDYIRNR